MGAYKKGKNKKKRAVVCAILAGLMWKINMTEASYPSYFNYCRENYTDKNSPITYSIVPEVWNQKQYGTCWTFATMASYQSNWNLQLKKNNISGTSPNFSERYIAWLGFASPLDGTWSDAKYHITPIESVIESKDKSFNMMVYNMGGATTQAFTEMMLWGNALNSEVPYDFAGVGKMQGVQSIVDSSGSVHDLYCHNGSSKSGLTKAYIQGLIKEVGVVAIDIQVAHDENHHTVNMSNDRSEYYGDISGSTTTGHAVAIVGWDDDYVFKYYKKADESPIKGAWIVRNSWGSQNVTQGYFYMPYIDTTFSLTGAFNPELDVKRYTQTDTNSFTRTGGNYITINSNAASYANKLTATTPQMLKAVTFKVPNDSISYKIEVLTDADLPTNGKVVYTQSGTFGTDGTPKYKGIRTVDFAKYVFLPEGKEYILKITIMNPKVSKIYVSGVTPFSNDTRSYNGSSSPGICYIYNDQTGQWEDTYYKTELNSTGSMVIPTFGRSKDSALPNGGDFTVVYLNDDGVGNSYVNLGKADELYGTDPLHPKRKTLSNMTVELTAGLTDSVYGGVIYGEGSVNKTGDGTLTLLGANEYTGATNVKEGNLVLGYLADGSGGSLRSPVNIDSKAALSGNGTVYNKVTNNGIVSPGSDIGSLTVDDYEQGNTGLLKLEGGLNVKDRLIVNNSAYIDGTIHVVPKGYFSNGENVLPLTNFIQAGSLSYDSQINLTSENAVTNTVQVLSTAVNVNDKIFTYNASRPANGYSNIAVTEDGLALGKVLDKVAGYQTGDGQNLVAGIDFFGLDIDNLGKQMQPRAYDSLMTANMRNQQFVGKSLVNEVLNRDSYMPADKENRIFAKAIRFSSHQNSWDRYDSYDNMVSGVLAGYERESGGWRYGAHIAYVSGNSDVDGLTPVHNDYYSGTLGIHGVKDMGNDFLYGYLQGTWERNEADRKTANSLYSRKQKAKWNGTGVSMEIGGGHSFRSKKYNKGVTPYASLNYSRLHWGNISEESSYGDSLSIDRDNSNYNSLTGTLGIKAQIGPHKLQDDAKAMVSYDATLSYEHEFLNNMPGYEYSVLGTSVYQNGYDKPARDVVRLALGANLLSDKKFTLRAEVGKAWGRQGYTELGAGLKGEWKF
jgi:autotransporter-associated beta strand protein